MLCLGAAYAIMLGASVMFMDSVEMNKHIFRNFFTVSSRTILVFVPYVMAIFR